MSNTSNTADHRALWTLAALEGGSVMVLEMMCAKFIAPAYGDTLQVWASVMGVTLAGLTIGYFLGAAYSEKWASKLWWLTLIAACGMMLAPALADTVIPHMITGNIFRDSLSVSAILLLPTLAIMGMVPALIVKGLEGSMPSGKAAGRVFAISTVGAIVAVYLNGFLLVPAWGVAIPLIVTGLALSVPSIIHLLSRKKWASILVLLPAIFAFGYHQSHRFPDNASLKVVHYKEGILGQVLVGDFSYQTPEGQNRTGRTLYVNRMPQTMVDAQSGMALFSPYLDFMDVATHPVGNGDLLLLGLGGGNLVSRFINQGRHVDVCELDKRVVEASEKYFGLANHPGARFIVDDARHFLRRSKKKYDLIAYDIFKGESPPHHAFTTEAFADASKILKPGGIILINFLGRTEGPRSKGPAAVIKTLQASGYQVVTLAIPNIDNVIVLAAKDRKPPVDPRLTTYLVPESSLDLASAPVLTDDRPMLELLHAETAAWNRAWYNKTYTTRYLEENVPLFR